MKRTIIIILSLLSVLLAGCSKSDVSDAGYGEVTVTYSVSAPSTKAFGKGESVNKVWYALYRTDGTLVKNYAPVPFENGSANCPVEMMRGHSYKVAFVAQHYSDAGVPTYEIDAHNASLVMPVEAVANSDDYDVFTYVDPVDNYQGQSADAVVLTRKVAQVNFIASDWDEAEALGKLPACSSVVFSKISRSYGIMTDTPSAETVSVNYAKSAVPGEASVLGTVFCFVGGGEGFATPAVLRLYDSQDPSAVPTRTVEVPALIMKTNFKTNVTCAIMTGNTSSQTLN